MMMVRKFLLKQQIKTHLAPAKEVPGVQVGNIAVRLLCELKQASCQPKSTKAKNIKHNNKTMTNKSWCAPGR